MLQIDRRKLAQVVAEALVRKWNDVEAIGLFGSVARGEDTKWSDIDMLCLVGSTSGKEDLFFMYQEVPIWVEVRTRAYVAERIKQPMPDWPISANKWYDMVPMYDPGNAFRELRTIIQTLPESFYAKGMEDSLLDAFLELNKIRANHEAHDEVQARDAAHRFAQDVSLFLAYLNHGFYRKGLGSVFKEYQEFRTVPPHYADEIHKLAGHVFVDLSALGTSAEKLWSQCLRTAELNGVGLRTVQRLEEI